MSLTIQAIFQAHPKFDGVRRINIYLLRLVYALMFFMLGMDSWSYILGYEGMWEPDNAMVWSVWAAFATLAGLGLLHPVKMLPILLLEIFYKILWLILVAYPLWRDGTLTGSPVAYQVVVFLMVVLPIVAVPWGYVFRTYVYKPRQHAA